MRKIIAPLLFVFAAFHPDAWSSGGQADAAFGNNGVASVPPADNYYKYDIAILADGRVLVVHPGTVSADAFMFGADGRLDASFGRGGIVTVPIQATAVTPLPDGRVLVAGAGAGKDLSFMRLNSSGSVDTTFGANGTATYPLGDLYGVSVQSMHGLPDGSVIVIAIPVSFYWDGASARYMTVAKLKADGALDEAYGSNGAVDHAFGYTFGGESARILDDGSVELVQSKSGSLLTKSRLKPDGSLDTSIGIAGVLSQAAPFAPDTYNTPLGVLMYDDGSLLAYGFPPTSGQGYSLKVARYGSDFALDRTFGTEGVATFPNISAGPADRTPDGGYMFVGTGSNGLTLFKTTGRGAPDPVFGVNGLAHVSLPVSDDTSSTSPYRARVTTEGYVVTLATSTERSTGIVRAWLSKAQAVGDLVEFRNSILNHYFVTYDGDEARGIDAGVAGPGWSRTGGSFRPGGTTPVCRFYGTPGVGPNSHFFTAAADECEAVKHAVGWTYEGLGFYTTPPSNGQCAVGLQAVHRLYNNRAAQNDSNHRFTTDPAAIAAMQAQGWIHEGIVFCAKT